MIDLLELRKNQSEFLRRMKSRDASWRLAALDKLEAALHKYRSEMESAVYKDLKKSSGEFLSTEFLMLIDDIKFMKKNLGQWIKPQKVKTPLMLVPASAKIYPEPLGRSLIIGAWNYPFLLTISPFVGALSAGCGGVLKPSELAPASALVMENMIKETFPEEHWTVVNGGTDVAKSLLDNERWDKIFFTGSSQVGKKIAVSAAEKLTPITLELGGKSPVLVQEHADLKVAAKRIAWAKITNCGQTCVAPDYVFVDDMVKKAFLEELVSAFKELMARADEFYGKIVNERHFDRLTELLEEDSSKVFYGGPAQKENLHIPPHILLDVSTRAAVMQEEIFGPILPVIGYKNIHEAINFINSRPKPLAAYVFGEISEKNERIIESLSFGGGCINDAVLHLANPHLPFGGVGESGQGCYHGRKSFDAFTHYKSVLKNSTSLELPVRYPPIKGWKKRVLEWFV